jgi:hypothetical protein
METTIQLVNGYDRKRKELLTFRNPSDIAELVSHCNSNSHIWFRSNDGLARQLKINGSVRTWKRDAGRIEIPVKYGLYEYGTFTADDISRVLIPVTQQ